MSLISSIYDLITGNGLVSVKDKYGTIWYRTTFNAERDFKPYVDVLGNKITYKDDPEFAALGEWVQFETPNKVIGTTTDQIVSIVKEEDKAKVLALKQRNVPYREFNQFDKWKLWLFSKLGLTTGAAKVFNWILLILLIWLFLRFIKLFRFINNSKRR